MTTTSYQGQYFQRAPGPRQDARRLVRLTAVPNREQQPPAGARFLEAGMQWLAIVCMLGFAVSYLLGPAFSALDPVYLPFATTQNMAAPTTAATDAEPHYPAFHEAFNLHPMQGDVEEPPTTF